MNLLLAESNTNLTAFITFVVIMAIVGFFVMRADKKRWDMQMSRSKQMDEARKKKKKDAPQDENAAADTAEEGADAKKEKKKKKEKKIPEGFVDNSNVKSDPYEYKGMISDTVLFVLAICFGAIGELFAMIIYRHRWYKWTFRAFMPACVILNVIVAVMISILIAAKGDSSILSN